MRRFLPTPLGHFSQPIDCDFPRLSYSATVDCDLDRLISKLLERRNAGALRADIRPSRFQHWTSTLSPGELRAAARSFVAQIEVAGDLEKRRRHAERLLRDSKRREPADDLVPATPVALVAAERKLDLRLPDAMKRLFCEVANGGFGPGEGLLTIAAIVTETLKARSDTATVGVQWPANLVIIQPLAPLTHCIDCNTDEVIAWNGEAFAKLVFDEAPAGEIEKAFFEGLRPVAPSLKSWLQHWLDGPSDEEIAEFEAMRDKAFAEARENARQRVEDYIAEVRTQTAEERARLGLTGEDWEEDLRKGLLGQR